MFYVALTRAKQRVYLIGDMANVSEFLVELLKNKYPVELNEFETSLAQASADLIHCVKCKTGTLVAVQGKPFYGCSNYPLCNHTEKRMSTVWQSDAARRSLQSMSRSGM